MSTTFSGLRARGMRRILVELQPWTLPRVRTGLLFTLVAEGGEI
jgi:hypothetical protein